MGAHSLSGRAAAGHSAEDSEDNDVSVRVVVGATVSRWGFWGS
jgi:hypothetical protein